MKLLFDHNLSPRLADRLLDSYPGSVHVRRVGLERASDETVWCFAADGGFVIVSKDSDFHQRSLLKGFPPKVIWVRRGNCRTAEIESLLREHRAALLQFEADSEGAFLELG